MSKIELRIKLLISGLLLLTAFLIGVLLYLAPALSQKEPDISQKQEQEAAINNENLAKSHKAEINVLKEQQNISKIENAAENKNLAISKSAIQPDKASIIVPSVKKKNKFLYFIIDDAGYSIEKLKPFLDFPGDITIAVLPGLPYSKQCAELALKKGKKIILHQPMESVKGNDTGPYAIKLGMNEDEITEILEYNINSLPGIIGVNNHMGSAITADERIMKIILKYLYNKKLFFIDSMTTPDSICRQVAANSSYFISKRDVFLDNIDERKAIMESINMGKSIAENKGYAVMIGHVWSSELADTMMQLYPNLIEEGFTLRDTRNFLMGEEYFASIGN